MELQQCRLLNFVLWSPMDDQLLLQWLPAQSRTKLLEPSPPPDPARAATALVATMVRCPALFSTQNMGCARATVSPRTGRVGFFSKASDLAVLTGTQVATLTFSPGGNAFSFGHPSIDSVMEQEAREAAPRV